MLHTIQSTFAEIDSLPKLLEGHTVLRVQPSSPSVGKRFWKVPVRQKYKHLEFHLHSHTTLVQYHQLEGTRELGPFRNRHLQILGPQNHLLHFEELPFDLQSRLCDRCCPGNKTLEVVDNSKK